MCPFRSWDSIICYISRMNQWIELIFHMLIHGVRKAKIYFGYAHGQIWLWPFRSYTISISIICVSQKEPRSSILKFEDKILIDNIIFISKRIALSFSQYSSQVNSTFFFDIRIYTHKIYTQFSMTEINTEIKTTATAVIKNELRYFLMSEGNTCIVEPKLEVLPFIWFSKGLV